MEIDSQRRKNAQSVAAKAEKATKVAVKESKQQKHGYWSRQIEGLLQ